MIKDKDYYTKPIFQDSCYTQCLWDLAFRDSQIHLTGQPGLAVFYLLSSHIRCEMGRAVNSITVKFYGFLADKQPSTFFVNGCCCDGYYFFMYSILFPSSVVMSIWKTSFFV